MKDFLLLWRFKHNPNFHYGSAHFDNSWKHSLVRAADEKEAMAKLNEWYKDAMRTMWSEIEIVNATIE